MNRKVIPLVALLISAVAVSAGERDVYLLVGQSNMAGRGELTPSNRVSCANVVKFSREGAWVAATEPIHFDRPYAGAGLAASFAVEMAKTANGREIALVPCAVGGTPIRRWLPGADLYTNAVNRCRAALASGGTLKGILWHQGESDAGKLRNVAAYGKRLKSMVLAFRRDLNAPEVPFVAGELGTDPNRRGGPGCDEVSAATRRVMEELPHCAFVSSSGLKLKPDRMHFDTPSLRLLGVRYADALRRAHAAAAKRGVPCFCADLTVNPVLVERNRAVADDMATTVLIASMNLVTIAPGHFHAALVQNRMYPEVVPLVKVFAPDGAELASHLKLIENFNARPENPTAWREDVYRGNDYLEKFLAAARAKQLGENPIVILAGKNNRKGDYALAAVEAGCNVLSDKPMAISPEVFAKTEQAARLAERKGLFFADIMTERNEITTILQRALTQDRNLYGEQEKGTPENPAVTKISVHHFCKLVNGAPLKRPEWYYDTRIQGEGISDVTTHLVDLVQWETFPGERLAKSDVEILSARTWPTRITPEQFKMSTGGDRAAAFDCEANGEFVWKLKGVACKVSVVWNFMAPKGTGDTHYSMMRGTKAEVFIRQGPQEGYKPVLYVKSRGADLEQTLHLALAKIAKDWPGVTAIATEEAGVWRVAYPKKYDIGHEAHFSQVVRKYLDWMKQGAMDPIYIDNMLVKYYTIVEALRLSAASGKGR